MEVNRAFQRLETQKAALRFRHHRFRLWRSHHRGAHHRRHSQTIGVHTGTGREWEVGKFPDKLGEVVQNARNVILAAGALGTPEILL
jgi:hypothetical protein